MTKGIHVPDFVKCVRQSRLCHGDRLQTNPPHLFATSGSAYCWKRSARENFFVPSVLVADSLWRRPRISRAAQLSVYFSLYVPLFLSVCVVPHFLPPLWSLCMYVSLYPSFALSPSLCLSLSVSPPLNVYFSPYLYYISVSFSARFGRRTPPPPVALSLPSIPGQNLLELREPGKGGKAIWRSRNSLITKAKKVTLSPCLKDAGARSNKHTRRTHPHTYLIFLCFLTSECESLFYLSAPLKEVTPFGSFLASAVTAPHTS